MDEYLKLLKRAKENMPDLKKEGERFEIPKADVVTGKQTVIKNFLDISKTLRRDPKHIAKFLFKEIAVPGSMNGNELVLQGRVLPSMINQRIAEYTKEFVFCNECGKADTMVQKADRTLILKCEACGARRSLRVI
jgi:translation initiation factor 2 subunit 2